MRPILLVLVALLASISGVAIGVMVNNKFPAHESDWVTFAGALLGAAITVAGAILVFEWQQQRDARRQWRMIDDQLSNVLYIVRSIETCEEPVRVRRLLIFRRKVAELKIAWEALKDSRRWVTPKSVHTIEAFARIDRINIDVDSYEQVLNLASEMEATGAEDESIDEVEGRLTYMKMKELEVELMSVRNLYKKGN